MSMTIAKKEKSDSDLNLSGCAMLDDFELYSVHTEIAAKEK